MSKQKTNRWFITLLVVTAFAAAVLVGCSSKSVQQTDTPSGTTVAVTASPTTVNTGATTVVEATVSASSSALANQVVTFTVSPSGCGYFTPTVDTTGADGVAASIFTATTSGAATLSASVSGSTYSGSTGVTISQSAQTGSGNVDMTITPSLLLANGVDTAQVTIAVRDGSGQPAPAGTVVRFTAGERFIDNDENGYWSPGIDSLVYDANANGQWDAFGLIPSTATIAGTAGTVTVNYIAGNDAMTVYLKATVNDNSIVGNVEKSLQLTPNATVNSIFLASDSINLVVKQTGGIESALLTATGYDINGNAVPEGIVVNFIITDGPGGGEHLGTVGYGPYQAMTNSQGVAVASIHSGTASGTIRVRAYVDTVLSNATQIMVSAGPPVYIQVGAENLNVPYWNVVAGENNIVALVSDVYNNPVPNNTAVYFTCDEGSMKSHETRTQDQEGIAQTVWFSGNATPGSDGKVWIYAETAGGTVLDSSLFYNSFYADTIYAVGVPASIQADGTSQATVTVWAYDFNGNPVVGGTKFEADASYLSVQGGTFEDGFYAAMARVKISSATLDVDFATTGGNDNGVGAYDDVYYYTASGATAVYTIAMTTGTAYSGNSIINGPSSAATGEAVSITVVVKDRWGNPLGDHTLVMTASGGVVTGGTHESNSYGEAVGYTWTAPGVAGNYTVTITDTDPRGGIVLTKTIAVQ